MDYLGRVATLGHLIQFALVGLHTAVSKVSEGNTAGCHDHQTVGEALHSQDLGVANVGSLRSGPCRNSSDN